MNYKRKVKETEKERERQKLCTDIYPAKPNSHVCDEAISPAHILLTRPK